MANIDIAGKLNAATAEGYVAEANQIHYTGGNGNVEDALKSLKTSVDDLNKNAQHYRFAGIEESTTAIDAMSQEPRALYYDKTAMTFVCLDQDGNYYKQWPEEFAPMAAYVTEFGEEPIAGKLFWSEDEEAFYYYSAAEWYKVEDDSVRSDVAKISDTLSEYMSAGYLTAPFPRVSFVANDDFTGKQNVPLKDGEIIPWTGWLTMVLCYKTTDSAAKVKLTGYAGPTLGKCELIAETAVAASEEPRVVRITGEHDYNPKRNGSPDACMDGSSYHVNVEVKSPNAGFTMLWAVVYESDEYGNPRRRGGSERELLTRCNCIQIHDGITSTDTFINKYLWSKPAYNDNTGLFEMNGLVDLTWNDMRDIVENDPFDLSTPQTAGGVANAIRTYKTSRRHYNISASANVKYANYLQSKNEVFAVPSPGYDMRQLTDTNASFYGNSNLRAILCVVNPSANPFELSTRIETFIFKELNKDITISASDYISYDSLAYMIDKATNSSAITVTVSATIYAKLSGSTIENWGDLKVLAGTKNVKLVAKGDAGYPFLKNVLWHSYAALNKKITDAANGDTIYINTADRYKLGDDDRGAQADNWGTLVTLAAEKNITFAQAE